MNRPDQWVCVRILPTKRPVHREFSRNHALDRKSERSDPLRGLRGGLDVAYSAQAWSANAFAGVAVSDARDAACPPGRGGHREELKQELWSEEDFGEFDLGLNTAVKKLRQALDDSANTPRFIETIPKVGYRFLVPVAASPGHELSSADSADSTVQTVNPVESLSPVFVPVRRSIQRALQGLAAVLGIALVGTVAVLFTQAPPETPEQPVRRFSFSQEGLSSASISPDGRYVAFAAGTIPESSLWLRAIGTETPREIPGTEGARERLGWSPDSQSIVFATTTEIKRLNIDGGDPVTLGDLPGTGPGGGSGQLLEP